MQKFYERYWQSPEVAVPSNDPTTPERMKLILSTVGNNKTILDFGCGTGLFSKAMYEAGNIVYGVDISQNAINFAKERYPDINFETISNEYSLPYSQDMFDAILATEVMEHIYDTTNTYIVFNKVLKNNGLLVLTVPYHGLLKNLAIVLFGFERHFKVEGAHIRFYTLKSLKSVLSRYGFEIIKTKRIGREIKALAKSIFVVAKKIRNLEINESK